jgi:DNA invertase Pin-like site-specific DNA recombinase
MPPRKRTAPPGTVAAYIRVSTEEQAASGAGLDAQRARIAEECARRGWTIAEEFADEGVSGKALANRPGLADALAFLDSGGAAVLMVAKLDRLSRSVADASALLERAKRSPWSIVSTDLAIDDTTPAGEAAAAMMIVFSQLERRLIGQRTSEALAVKRAQGVQLGRPDRAGAEVVARIRELRNEGLSFAKIADRLNSQGVPTAQGGARWYPSSARAALVRRGVSA